jgi:hypothetical protein
MLFILVDEYRTTRFIDNTIEICQIDDILLTGACSLFVGPLF